MIDDRIIFNTIKFDLPPLIEKIVSAGLILHRTELISMVGKRIDVSLRKIDRLFDNVIVCSAASFPDVNDKMQKVVIVDYDGKKTNDPIVVGLLVKEKLGEAILVASKRGLNDIRSLEPALCKAFPDYRLID